jgi:hypothetical protein
MTNDEIDEPSMIFARISEPKRLFEHFVPESSVDIRVVAPG